MVKFYVLQVRLGMSIDEVPERYRDKVKEELIDSGCEDLITG